MSKNSTFYKYLFIFLLKKYIPISKPTKSATLQYLIWFCAFISISVFIFSYYGDWYEKSGVFDGLITELHGIIIELFVFTILLNWILEIREELRFKEPKAFAYAKVYSEINKCLSALVEEYYVNGEKQYVYFSTNMEISRKLDSTYYSNHKLSNAEEFILKKNGYDYFLEKYINKVKTLKENIKSDFPSYLYLMDPIIIHNIQNILEEATNITEKTNSQTKENFNIEVAKEFMKSCQSLIWYLYTTKKSLEEVANTIQTREEHSAAMTIEREKLKKEYEGFK